MTESFGELLYRDIDSNPYLNEIYEAVLFNYSLRLLKNKKTEARDIELSHALRFADILSKSIHQTKAEKHKIWAQEIAALLNELYPKNSQVQYYLSSILMNTGNYRGLKLSDSTVSFFGTNLLDWSYNEFIRETMKIPADPERHFFKSQKRVYDGLKAQYFSYSGPTSMGKSFIMRMFIKKQIMDGEKKNFAILVPTKALINEVSSSIVDDLKGLLAQQDYKMVTSAGALALERQHNFILVLTPERLLYLLLEKQNFHIDYLFVDEAHKISSQDSRSAIYFKVIDLVARRYLDTHIIFSSPNIPNPNVYLRLIPAIDANVTPSIACTYAPVSQTKYLVDLTTANCVKVFNEHANKFLDICSFKGSVGLCQLIKVIGKEKNNIVYCSSKAKAIGYALEFADNHCKSITVSSELRALINDVRTEVHSDYYLAKVLEKGVAYHIGYLPTDIRMRIEELYRSGDIHTVFCTSTLVEGVNLPAENLFITSYKTGLAEMKPVEFRNLIGRVGRIEYNLYGNVFLVNQDDERTSKKFESLLKTEIPQQSLSLLTELTGAQKRKIIECLLEGNIELLKYPEKHTDENYALMRKFAIILLRDIQTHNATSRVYQEFSQYLDDQKVAKVLSAFSNHSHTDDDINVSVDQLDNLHKAIAKGLEYPKRNSEGLFEHMLILHKTGFCLYTCK
ncbi:MAG: DEAD/DEAH box helicase [Holosporales bacterium]|nr:DEAD/DEAH box helicase [Holosporales bacterium]